MNRRRLEGKSLSALEEASTTMMFKFDAVCEEPPLIEAITSDSPTTTEMLDVAAGTGTEFLKPNDKVT